MKEALDFKAAAKWSGISKSQFDDFIGDEESTSRGAKRAFIARQGDEELRVLLFNLPGRASARVGIASLAPLTSGDARTSLLRRPEKEMTRATRGRSGFLSSSSSHLYISSPQRH